MKKSFLGFMLISLMGLALSQKALASTDPASSWEHLEKQREQQQREQDAREQRARLIQARARHIAEALELTETETGEPASAFTYKCYQGEGVLSDCKAQDAGVIQYYRTILLQSRNKICKYVGESHYINHAPAFMGFFGHHDVELIGSVTCYDRSR